MTGAQDKVAWTGRGFTGGGKSRFRNCLERARLQPRRGSPLFLSFRADFGPRGICFLNALGSGALNPRDLYQYARWRECDLSEWFRARGTSILGFREPK